MEKKSPFVKIRTLSSAELDHDGELQSAVNLHWQPGFWKRFPWTGLCALILVLLCSASSVVVLEVANGKSQDVWPTAIPPNLLISTLNSIAGICFTIAIANGVAIAWWRRTLKGASIADLNRSWMFSTSFKEILFSLKYFNVVALGALAAKLTIIDGSLMQKALTFYNDVDVRPLNVNVTGFSSHYWPLTGSVHDSTGKPNSMTSGMFDTLSMWARTNGDYPNVNFQGCNSAFCYIEVEGIGFEFDCPASEHSEKNVNYGKSLSQMLPGDASETLFDVSFDVVYTNTEDPDLVHSHLTMNVTWNENDGEGTNFDCPSVQKTQFCRLHPAIIKYPVQVQDIAETKTVSVGPNGWNKQSARSFKKPGMGANPDLKAFGPNGQQEGFGVVTTVTLEEKRPFTLDNSLTLLSGLQLAFTNAFGGQANLTLSKSFGKFFYPSFTGSANTYFLEGITTGQQCYVGFLDPFESVIGGDDLFKIPSIPAMINQIMFGLSLDISQTDYVIRGSKPPNAGIFTYATRDSWGDGAQYSWEGKKYAYTVHYKVETGFMWGAVAATIMCVLLVIPVYWGFWELGRKVSLNPFEIAHAFRSPVFRGASRAEPEGLVEEVGSLEIKYGPIAFAGHEYGRLGVAEPENVARLPTGRPRIRFG